MYEKPSLENRLYKINTPWTIRYSITHSEIFYDRGDYTISPSFFSPKHEVCYFSLLLLFLSFLLVYKRALHKNLHSVT